MLTFLSIFSLNRCYEYLCLCIYIYNATIFILIMLYINMFYKILDRENMVAFICRIDIQTREHQPHTSENHSV